MCRCTGVNPYIRHCECGCGCLLPSERKRYSSRACGNRVRRQLPKYRAKRIFQKRRARARLTARNKEKRALQADCRAADKRFAILVKAWKAVFGWTSKLRDQSRAYWSLPNPYIDGRRQPTCVQTLRTSWCNITQWTACLAWHLTVTPDPTNQVDGRFLVYGLVDPRTLEVRYVGQSRKGLYRPKQHRNTGGGRSVYKDHWTAELRDAGLTFNIVVLEYTEPDITTLNQTEMYWIAYGRACGWRLTNLTDGGDGGTGRALSDETKAKISAARRRTSQQATETRRRNRLLSNGLYK